MLEQREIPANPLSGNAMASCTPFEFEVLKIGKEQLSSGPHGGNFTPGFLRKETGKGYNAINAALASLTRGGLLERGSHITQRDGQQLEVSLYKITEKGIEALMKIGAGQIKIEERIPMPKNDANRKERRESDDEIFASIKKLEADVAGIVSAIEALHAKLDRMAVHPIASQAQRAAPQKRARKSDIQSHTDIALRALKDLAGNSRHALAQDVERMYGEECSKYGLRAGSGAYFKKVLTDLEKKGYLKRKYVGCRSLGIHGHGSRLMLELTGEGIGYLSNIPGANT